MRPFSGWMLVCSLCLGVQAAEDGKLDRRDGSRRTAEGGGETVGQGQPDAGLKLYPQEVEAQPFSRLTYGFDRDAVCADGVTACSSDSDCGPPNDLCGDIVDSVTPGTQTTIWDLVCNPVTPGGNDCQTSSWDFSNNNLANFPGMPEIASSTANVDSSQTCNWNQCGFNEPGARLGREDRNFDDPPNTIHVFNVTETEDRSPQDVTIWLRAVASREGLSGGLGQGESRLCYAGTDSAGNDRAHVALFQFQTCDVSGCYMELGDFWEPEDPITGDPRGFQCENTVFNHVCPNSCGLFCPLWSYACGGFSGRQFGEVVNEGTVTLPSGHTFDTLVVRNTTEFCIALGSACGFNTDTVRTVNYLWIAPNIGTVVRLQSQKTAPADLQSYTSLAELDIKFGIFPPRTITPGTVTDTSVDLSWDPGLDTHRIDRYRVYWDTDSGAATPYAFDSVNHSGQVGFDGSSATVGGLSSCTRYHFTVTAVSDYVNPSSLATTTFESLLFPTQVTGGPQPIPQEITAATTGTPPSEVTGLTVDKSGSDVEMCWNAVADPCVDGYQILGATSPESATNFSAVVPDTGPTTCHTFNPTETYFLVVGKGSGGTGPWGHYDQ